MLLLLVQSAQDWKINGLVVVEKQLLLLPPPQRQNTAHTAAATAAAVQALAVVTVLGMERAKA